MATATKSLKDVVFDFLNGALERKIDLVAETDIEVIESSLWADRGETLETIEHSQGDLRYHIVEWQNGHLRARLR